MAVIETINQAIARVRLLIDKADSPYMTMNEISEFLTIAMSDFIRKRVTSFGASQAIRDDLGDLVVEKSFVGPAWNAPGTPNNVMVLPGVSGGVQLSNLGYDGQLSYAIENAFDGNRCCVLSTDFISPSFGNLISIVVRKPAENWANTYPGPSDNPFAYNPNRAETYFGDEPTYHSVKIIELDDMPTIRRDPFNAPSKTEYRAVRVGKHYELYPFDEFELNEQLMRDGARPNLFRIIFTYVTNATNILNIPLHAREEVCQIAARKILGVIADERYNMGNIETQNLRK